MEDLSNKKDETLVTENEENSVITAQENELELIEFYGGNFFFPVT